MGTSLPFKQIHVLQQLSTDMTRNALSALYLSDNLVCVYLSLSAIDFGLWFKNELIFSSALEFWLLRLRVRI